MNDQKEYIERGALIDSFENCYWLYNSTDREIVRQALENAPVADVAPVVHGEWKFIDHDETGYEVECTHCGTHYTFPSKAHLTKHCPECGAKMDGDSDAG